MNKTHISLSLLLAGAMIYGCSSAKKDPPVTNNVSSGGTPAAGGTAAGGTTTGGTTAGGTAGTAVGGTAAGGTSGAATGVGVGVDPDPATGMCPRRSLLHPDDMKCYCQPATLTMCTDGCVDPQLSADHCGDCVTACAAAAECNAGVCAPTPVVAVPAPATACGSIHMALGGGVLYWTDMMNGTVQSQATAGGAATSIATAQMGPTTIMVRGTSLFWLNTTSNEIMMAPTAGGVAPTALVTVVPTAFDGGTTSIGGFTVSADGATLYFAAGKVINKITVASPATITEVGHEDSGIPKALAVEDTLIGYPADINGDVDIMTMVAAGPSVCASDDSTTAVNNHCARAGRSQGSLNLENVVITGGTIYWANQASILSSSAVAPAGQYTTIATGNPNASKVAAFTINGTTVYFADDTGLVLKAPLMPMAATTKLARTQMGVTGMAADETIVYWANADCEILSVPAN